MSTTKFTAQSGKEVRIIEVNEYEARMETDEVYPEYETVSETFVKNGDQLFRKLDTGVEVGPMCESLQPSGYFIRSDLSAAKTLVKTLGLVAA